MAVAIGEGEQGLTATTQIQLRRLEACLLDFVTIAHEQGDTLTTIAAQLTKGILSCAARDTAVKTLHR